MPSQLATNRTLAVVVSALGLCSACGIGDNYNAPPPPPPPQSADLSLSSKALSFAPTTVGETSPGQQVTLTNLGDTALRFFSVGFSSRDREFAIGNNTCTGALQPRTTCRITLAFQPQLAAVFSQHLDIHIAGFASQIISLTGTGTTPHKPAPSRP